MGISSRVWNETDVSVVTDPVPVAHGGTGAATAAAAQAALGPITVANGGTGVATAAAARAALATTVRSYAALSAAGTDAATAGVIATEFVLVSGANGTVGVILPVPVAGQSVIIKNNAAGALKVWPNAGAAINAVTGDAYFSMGNLTSAMFIASSATQWFTVPLVPS